MKAKDRRFYVEELRSDECQCGNWKRPKNTFCYTCYRSLPEDIQRALYKGMGKGYEEAREDAAKHLSD